MSLALFSLYWLVLCGGGVHAAGNCDSKIDRRAVVRQFNPHRNASSSTTPLQVGNGNFAFGVDITGLQTFAPFGTLSTWGWHNFSLPTTVGQTSVDGKSWLSLILFWLTNMKTSRDSIGGLMTAWSIMINLTRLKMISQTG
jgi:hypothetical protein